jgi:hypothetical protein
VFTCQNCHGLNPAMGFFGTRGENVVEGETQFFKVTQLRTVYDKVGMFGRTNGRNANEMRPTGGPRINLGPQVRGTGTLHDGSDGGAEEFLTAGVFQLNATQLRDVVNFVYAFPSNLAPIVGQQVTLRADSGADVNARIDLLQQRAATPFVMPGNVMVTECDLIARTVIDGEERGYLFQPNGASFLADDGSTMSAQQVRGLADRAGQEVTFTCVYPGGGRRLAMDRNADGMPDRRQ